MLKQIHEKIKSCQECNDMVEKFTHSESVYIGNNKELLLLGEAPANNGWRKSGMLWKDLNGKLLPSGVILQKLLDILEIDLFDISFTEAVKCYPKERKYLPVCVKSCQKYLSEQIEVLKPKIIISLGNHATRSIINIEYKNFSKVVGKVFKYSDETIIIPIYHPSPISPKSYKGNVPIFYKIKELLDKEEL